MGAMLGFRFPENFDQPYRSTSVTEFWRRWHMTLSRWFRDYVYIPLGGNRHGTARTFASLAIVFILCGLWHGAAYTFLMWGLLHGALLILERVLGRFGLRPRGLFGWLYTMTAVMIAWVFFRAPSVADAITHLTAMLGGGATQSRYPLIFYLTADKAFYLAAATAIALLPHGTAPSIGRGEASWPLTAFATLALILSVAQIAGAGFNPFIYFRF
jgi:alginate O-acetyltransferase complex protein AlgI